MGVVRKQSLYITIIVYLGFALGALNVLYLFPNFFTPEQFGLTRVLFAVASTFMQLASLGIPTLMIKFFPYYNDRLEKKENDFLFLSLIIPTLGFIVVSAVLLFFKEKAIVIYEKKSPLFVSYFDLIFVFSFSFMLYRILETYASILFKNIIPAFIREVVIRFFHLVLILFFILSINRFNQFINLYVLVYFVGLILLIAYIVFLKKWNISAKISGVSKRLKKTAYSYGTFVYGGGLLIILAENIDTILIAGIAGLQSTAVFAVASYISTIIQVPQKSMNTVVAPMVAQAWKNKDFSLIDRLYKKTAVTQLCTSLFMFLLIWINIDSLFSFLPPIYAEGKNIILFMGLARVIDQGMGINGELLNTSKFWKVSFVADVLLIALSIPTNYFLIKEFGIVGSAYANFLAFTVFNSFRFAFVWKKFGMQPFTSKIIAPVLLAAAIFGVMEIIPHLSNPIVDIGVRSVLIGVMFGGIILKLQVSEDINLFATQILTRIKNKK